MTKREMIEAVLAGKTVVNVEGDYMVYDEDECPPFRYKYKDGTLASMGTTWDDNWHIAMPPKKRPMTREEVLGFLANTPGIVVKNGGGANDWAIPCFWAYNVSIDGYEWATIDAKGNIGEPHAFEVEE